MAITFNSENKVFKLDAKNTTYAFYIHDGGWLVNLYYGKSLNSDELRYLENTQGVAAFAPHPVETNYHFTLDCEALEYPCNGRGDFRASALQIRAPYGGSCTDIRYDSYKIYDGKYSIPGQPAVYAAENEAQTLEVLCKDALTGAEVTLYYTVFNDLPVITRTVKIENKGSEAFDIERVFSACVDFKRSDFDLINLYGAHNMERRIARRPLAHGNQGITSRRGASSHYQNPFIALCEHSATEEHGEVFGFSFVYAGNHEERADVDTFDQTRVLVGICPDDFGWHLEIGESFMVPECVMVYSDGGLGDMSRAFHKLYRNNLCRGPWKLKERPVLINNWEATYFNFNEQKIADIASVASELGIDMLVLDDGWFGERNNDRSSLGDWFVNEEKLKGGLGALVEKVNSMGMKFGLWFEPEMISPVSKLYEAHPDWCLHVNGRSRSLGRHQLILDMSREDVRDYLFESMSKILSSANIAYVKWDFNRNLTEVASDLLPHERQKETAHRFVLGLYDLLERLLTAFPDLLLEGCSGGGGRFDPAMLYYSPQIWTSDDTDALERCFIQYGTSMVYPASSISAHVSASPNHQTGRSSSLVTRGHVAMAGAFGYELDLSRCTDEEKELMKKQIADYKKYADVVQNGDFYRLISPFDTRDYAAWQYVASDKKQTLVTLVALHWQLRPSLYLKLKGLDPEKVYVNAETGERYTGAVLMNAGLNFARRFKDGDSYQIHFIEE